MREFLNRIRKPVAISPSKGAFYSAVILLSGLLFGLFSKVLDETASNALPPFLETLDLRNFFSRMGIWIFLAVLISVTDKTPLRAAINVFLFFVGMLSSYYTYTALVSGFFPRAYVMIWVGLTLLSPILAFVCWYARGKGNLSICISAIIYLMIARQAFAFGFWYLDVKYGLELLVWMATILVLYQSPKQIGRVAVLGTLLFFLTAQINLFWGML